MLKKARLILKALYLSGFKAYLVGGCVRDIILGKEPKDYDICTDARPDQIKQIFPLNYPVGEAFGIIKVNIDGDLFDVATFRSEKDYSDGRRPDFVKFETHPKEDVTRRDFTINGLLMDYHGEILDFVGGEKDLERGIIRTIGNPDDRFKEDYLRIMRAARFSCRFGFEIESETFHAMSRNANGLDLISKERISEELKGILKTNCPTEGIIELTSCGAMKYIIPEFLNLDGCTQPPEFHKYDVLVHTLIMLKNANIRTFELGMSILLHDIAKPKTRGVSNIDGRITFYGHAQLGEQMSRDICKNLKLSNEETDLICLFVGNHMKAHNALEMSLAKIKKLCRMLRFEEFLELHRVDILASAKQNFETYEFLSNFYKDNKETIKPTPLINGDVLISLGLKPGPQFKIILNKVEEMQLNGQLRTTGEAIDFVLSKKENYENC